MLVLDQAQNPIVNCEPIDLVMFRQLLVGGQTRGDQYNAAPPALSDKVKKANPFIDAGTIFHSYSGRGLLQFQFEELAEPNESLRKLKFIEINQHHGISADATHRPDKRQELPDQAVFAWILVLGSLGELTGIG